MLKGSNQSGIGNEIDNLTANDHGDDRIACNTAYNVQKDDDGEVFVVLLNNGVMISAKKQWIESPDLVESKIFYSSNHADQAVFTEPVYYFKPDEVRCYNGRIIERFGKIPNTFLLKTLLNILRLQIPMKKQINSSISRDEIIYLKLIFQLSKAGTFHQTVKTKMKI